MSVAWAGPGREREVIPTEFLSSYGPEVEDADDDYLPDAWELEYGLDPLDNGLIDRAHQGERGDLDLDGLSNREEYVLGTDPSNADSDADGLSDLDEIRNYGTNPNLSDAPSERLVETVDLASYTSDDIDWNLTSQGLIPSLFRGSATWDFTVPTDGYWSINIATKLLGNLYLQEIVDFEITIDGQALEKRELVYGQGTEATLRVLTPYLTAGQHRITLNIDNLLARRTVSILSIQVLEPQGADLDGDGLPDWINAKLLAANTLLPYEPASRTSPAFVEGYASRPAEVTLNNTNVLRGVDDHHWYADVPLHETAATSFNVSFEANFADNGSIQWQETNVLDSETLIVRKGDSLKLVAKPDTGVTGQEVAVSLPPVYLTELDGITATQTSTRIGGEASRAIDGNISGAWGDESYIYTANKVNSWWQLDLAEDREISSVVIWNVHGARIERLNDYRVSVLDEAGAVVATEDLYYSEHPALSATWELSAPVIGRKVKVELVGTNSNDDYRLTFAEVQVFGERRNETLTTDSEHLVYEFREAGTQTIDVTHANGSSGTLTVEVKQADFSEEPQDLLSQSIGNVQLARAFVDSDLYFEGGEAAPLTGLNEETEFNTSLQVAPEGKGSYNMLARLYEDGPVLNAQPLSLIAFADVLQTNQTVTLTNPAYEGYLQVISPITLTGIPEGGSIKVTIHRGGVTFLDGTTTLRLTAEDFTNGVYNINFLYPLDGEGGYCHYIDIYDRNGEIIARR